MSASPTRRAPLQWRALTTADLPAALALTEASHWSHRMHDWQLHLALGQGFGACEADGTLVGTALWWDYGGRRATLGLVVVRADCQGRGIGRQLLQAVLAASGERPVGLVATAAGLRLYEDCGFVATGGILQCLGEAAGDGKAGACGADVTVRALADTDVAAVHALDSAAFGAPRRALLVAVLGAGRPALVAMRAGRLAGFALQRPAGRGVTVGPVVAPDEAVAIALATRALDAATHREGSGVLVRLDIPAAATGLAAALENRGLRIVDRVTAMQRGAAAPVDPAARLFGLASQAFG